MRSTALISIMLCALSNLSAQQPLNLWEHVVGDHLHGGYVAMYSMGEHLLVTSTNDNDSINIPDFYLKRSGAITKLDKDGEVLARGFTYHNNLPVYRALDVNVRDTSFIIGNTIEINDTLVPNVMEFNYNLELIDSKVSNHFAVRPPFAVRALFRSSGVIIDDLFYHVNPSADFTRDSARIFVTGISIEGTIDTQIVHEVKPLLAEYRSLHHSPSTGTIISKGNGGMTLLDEQLLGTGNQYLSITNDSGSTDTPENNDEFFHTGAECTDGAAVEINGVYYQANASVGTIGDLPYTATIVEKWSPTRGFLARAAVNIDTFTWQPSTCFDWLAAGLGRNAIASDGSDGIYLVSNVMQENHTYVAHCDTNLNVRWRRDWQNKEVRFGHSVATIDGYDGVYIASIQNPDNSFIGQGELILNRLPSDGGEVVGTSSAIELKEISPQVLLYPNPAIAGSSIRLEGKQGAYAYAKLYDTSGKSKRIEITSDLRIELPEDLTKGIYTCALFTSQDRFVAQQQLVVQ